MNAAAVAAHRSPLRLHLLILDRYMLTELGGPFVFGLSAFTLIFAAASILNIGKLVSNDHAPLWAAIEVFLWSLPATVVLVIPMAMLLATLLAVQRLSGENEITAMKAGGIAFVRITAPFLIAGLAMSFVMLFLQEEVVPFAQDQESYLVNEVINSSSAFGRELTVRAPLPGGGQQVTIATGYEPHSQALLKVTLIQYNRENEPTQVAFADRARFEAQRWLLDNVNTYRFSPNGATYTEHAATTEVDIGQTPTEIVKRITHGDPEQMSRAQILELIRSGQLNSGEVRKYTTTYQEKLARPFACFVFTLIALPFGLQAVRGGGNTSLGFGMAVAIVFVYYVVATFFSYVGDARLYLAPIAAWTPNLIFTYFGIQRLRTVAAA